MTGRRARRRRRGGLSPERLLAASILEQVESGRRLDVAWEASGAPSSPRRAWIRTLVYGSVRLRGRIDSVLARHCGCTVSDLDPEVRIALRMGAYQILEMDGVPDYAAVSQSVEQLKRTRRRAAAGLVNAVLRTVVASRYGTRTFPDPARDLAGYLETWGSHPGWMVRRWIRQFGEAGARRLVEANNTEPDIYLRPVGVDVAEAEQALNAAGLRATAANGGSVCRLRQGVDPAEALRVVPGVIQDPAAALVVDYASPDPGSFVADLCAAPGGKAMALSAVAGSVLAADRSAQRLARVAEARRRLNARAWLVVADARTPPLREAGTVLVDVPCSGTGTLRRHPDGRWRMGEDGIDVLAGVQERILEGAASVVPRGGLLVYATCALEPEENRGQVTRFLARHPDFRIEPGNVPDGFLDSKGCLAVLPQESGFDGAFAARLRRRVGV